MSALEGYGGSWARFEEVAGWLDGPDAASLTHADLEGELDRRGRELVRQMLQDHLDGRARRECRCRLVNSLKAPRRRSTVPAVVRRPHCRRVSRRLGTPCLS